MKNSETILFFYKKTYNLYCINIWDPPGLLSIMRVFTWLYVGLFGSRGMLLFFEGLKNIHPPPLIDRLMYALTMYVTYALSTRSCLWWHVSGWSKWRWRCLPYMDGMQFSLQITHPIPLVDVFLICEPCHVYFSVCFELAGLCASSLYRGTFLFIVVVRPRCGVLSQSNLFITKKMNADIAWVIQVKSWCSNFL